MNVIYIGSSRPESTTDELIKLGSRVNFAGNTLQNALLEGFSKLCPKFKVISAWTTTTYPKVKKLLFPRRYFELNGSTTDNYVCVGSLNLPIINLLSKYLRTKKQLKRMLDKNDDNAVIIYEVHTPFLLAATSLRKKIKHINVIVPDLPEFMSGNVGKLHKLLKSIDHVIITRCLKKVDSYSLLSEGMQERLPIEGKAWTLMEGIFQKEEYEEPVEKASEKVIMYTGNIFKRRGVDLLLNAFQLIDKPEYRLWIRGNGDLKDEIIARSKQDSRIVYFEPMSLTELRKMERKATVMVNTTPPSMDFTKYFFPSKTMEYLASGTVTVMFRLECMPEEYDSYIYYVEEESVDALKDKLLEVCEKSREELLAFGQNAREFILTKKTPVAQCQKVIDLFTNYNKVR